MYDVKKLNLNVVNIWCCAGESNSGVDWNLLWMCKANGVGRVLGMLVSRVYLPLGVELWL